MIGQEVRESRERLRALAPDLPLIDRSTSAATHQHFGQLRARQWLRFLGIHQHHHLKIIRDIKRSAPRGRRA
jgi:hypothetical protein